MNSSKKLPSRLNVTNIHFSNGTNIGDTSSFTDNVHFKKRVRVDGDIEALGQIPYVDNQTGWGLNQWTFANGDVYDKNQDSLIAKLGYIETNYATKEYVDSQTYSAARGLIYYLDSTYPKKTEPSATYPFPVTTLAANTGMIFRDDNSTTMDLKFQKGSYSIGDVLTCVDTEGTVGWGPSSGGGGTTVVNSIESNNGASNNFSFRVIDTGLSGTSVERGFFVYPQILNNYFNKAITANDFTILLGKGTLPSSQDEQGFIGPYSNGSEGLSFKSTYNDGSTTYFGKTKMTGGYYNSANGMDQSITLDSSGTKLNLPPNYPAIVNLNRIDQDLTNNKWSKPFIVRIASNKDEYPVFAAMKQDVTDSSINRGVVINPYLNQGNFNDMVKYGDIGIIAADWNTFFSDGGTSVYNEKDFQLFIGPWSAYCDGITIRPSLQSEESVSPPGMISGYTRIAACSGQLNQIPNWYVEVNRNGMTILEKETNVFSNFKIVNKSGAILNNPNTTAVTSSFTVGSSSSPVSSSLTGSVSISGGNLYISPLNNAPTVGYVLTANSTTGQAIWKAATNSFTSLSVSSELVAGSIISSQYSTVPQGGSSGTKIYQFSSGGGKICYYDNMVSLGSHQFTALSSTMAKATVLQLSYDYITLGKPLYFADGTIQNTAYTGAKSLAGSYTNANITIDTNGKITALTNGVFTFPSTVSTAVTFTAPVSFTNDVNMTNITCTGSILASTSACEVGILNVIGQSGFNSQSYFNGDIFYTPNKAINRVLTCTDGATGKVEWVDPTYQFPENSSVTNLTVSDNLNVTGYSNMSNLSISNLLTTTNANITNELTCGSITVGNSIKSKSISSAGLNVMHTMDTIVSFPSISTGLNFGDTGQLRNFNQNTIYHSMMNDFVKIGHIIVPPGYRSRLQINIPFSITHQWCFRQNLNDTNGGNEKTKFFYYVEKVHVLLKYNGLTEHEFSIQNSVAHTTKDLGYFKMYYDRVANGGGPNDDKHTMTHTFVISNPSFQFMPIESDFSKQYDVYTRFYWSTSYLADGDDNLINSFWGNNEPSHYFDDWWIILNPSSTSQWLSYSYDNQNGDVSSVHNQQYKDFIWERTNFLPLSNFVWGDWNGDLPWGQMSYLGYDPIFADAKILCDVGQFNTLVIKDILQSTGLIQCRGYMGRAGLGSENSNSNLTYADLPSTNGLTANSWFNIHWTGDKVETWIDFTKILSQSPNVSDYRIKSNFKNVEKVLDHICETSIYQFDIDYEVYKAVSKTGVIAHELSENFCNFPRLVQGIKDGVDREGKIIPQSVDYQELTIILMKGIQELRDENKLLKEEINEIRTIIQSLIR
jgi:hypothetical protein